MRHAAASLMILTAIAAAQPSWKEDWSGLLQPVKLAQLGQAATPVEQPAEARDAADLTAPPEAATESVEAESATFITPGHLLAGLRDELRRHFDLEGELRLMPDTPLTKIRVPDASWAVELVNPLPPTLSARMHLRFRLTDGFRHQAEETLAVRAEWWRDAIVSNRALRPGQLATADAYTIQSINWLQYRGDLVPAGQDMDVLRLKSTWRVNEPLRWHLVETRPLIEAGAIVEVVADEGALRITMRGVALESGHVGELINVRNLQSRKEIQGIVSHENTVLVAF